MRKFKKILSDEVCNKLEAAHYEVESRTNLLGYMLSKDNEGKFSSELIKEYNNEYTEFYKKYDYVKKEFTDSELACFKDHKFNWEVDFVSHICIITLLCNCDIEIDDAFEEIGEGE